MICKNRLFSKGLLAGFIALCLVLAQPMNARADDKENRIAAHQAMAIQSNSIPGWPTGPVVSAESAILIDAESGTILYAKNIHQQQYPASTTKILTALLAYENSSLDEIVTFSHDDVFGIPRGSNNIAMDVGYTLSMDDCLHALLIRSANEVAYAMAAHVGGSWDAFAEMMNKRAKELGAVDSNFVNPNGLPDENHVTSAYDLAMIGRAFFANDYLCNITLQPKLQVEKPNGTLVEWNQMALIPTGKYAYEYLVGCKTGYTDSARSALVSCAEKNGMRLICVVLHDENPQHNEDTIALFEYGFNNFKKVNVAQSETKYDIDNIGFFYNDGTIFDHSEPILSINKDASIILPNTVNFKDLTSTISYDTMEEGQAALITYSYNGMDLGTVSLDLNTNSRSGYSFESEETPASEESIAPGASKEEKQKKAPLFISINPKKVLTALVILAILALIALFILFLRKNYEFSITLSSLFRSRRRPRRSRRSRERIDLRASNEIQKMRNAQIKAAKKRYRERNRHR